MRFKPEDFLKLIIISQDRSKNFKIWTVQAKMCEIDDDKNVYRLVRENPGIVLHEKVDNYHKKLIKYKCIRNKMKLSL